MARRRFVIAFHSTPPRDVDEDACMQDAIGAMRTFLAHQGLTGELYEVGTPSASGSVAIEATARVAEALRHMVGVRSVTPA